MNCVEREPETGPWGPLTSGCCGEEGELVMEEESPGPWHPSRASTGEGGGGRSGSGHQHKRRQRVDH